MATDINKILSNLFEFYDFKEKTIISVGAGGGQFIEYGRNAKKVIAIDNDRNALDILEKRLKDSGLKDKFTLIHSDFEKVKETGDVVMFEFCLHEMYNPKSAIEFALKLAPDVLITDHWPTSEWAFIVDETEKAHNSWDAIRSSNPRKIQQYDSFQFFHSYEELHQRVKIQGQNSINRIRKYENMMDITIPMSYGFALI